MQNSILTVIIPVFQWNEKSKGMLSKALESLNIQRDLNFNVTIVYPDFINPTEFESLPNWGQFNWLSGSVYLLKNDTGNFDYASQVNFAVKTVSTEYFSVLQFDDIVLPNYTQNASKYTQGHNNFGMFCPIIIELDMNEAFLGFANESVWSHGHGQSFGEFDLASARQHGALNYSLCGAITSVKMFESCGGLKPSMRRFGEYEFLLRVLNKGNKVMVIPKICYKHVNGNPDGIFDRQRDMAKEEAAFWHNTAKKEYYFSEDRQIKYSV